VVKRYDAYGWRTLSVEDVNDVGALDRVMKEAATPDGRPTLVRVTSVIGYGAPNLANTSKAHGSPLGPEEVAGAKRAYGWDYPEPFTVPEEARAAMDQHERGAQAHSEWRARFDAYAQEHPELAADFERRVRGELPEGWDADLPDFDTGESIATRKASGAAINALAARVPELIGGSADLSTSNNTKIKDAADITREDFSGRNLNFGVREHAMMSALNGIATHGGLRAYGATFTTFTDYLRPALRLSAVMKLPTILVTTHDSIGLGEDGPTHQPVEHLAALRAMPHLHVLRPADARETAGAWRQAMARTDGPNVLLLSRQDLPVLERSAAEAVARGAYVVHDPDGGAQADLDVVLLATGSEVSLAIDAAGLLAARDIAARVVSMPCWELFEEQEDDYLDEVLPPEVPVLSVEAATSFGWSRWADDWVSLDTFGASAPAKELFAEFGFTPEAVADQAQELVELLEDDDEDEEHA
jgi:transketolase